MRILVGPTLSSCFSIRICCGVETNLSPLGFQPMMRHGWLMRSSLQQTSCSAGQSCPFRHLSCDLASALRPISFLIELTRRTQYRLSYHQSIPWAHRLLFKYTTHRNPAKAVIARRRAPCTITLSPLCIPLCIPKRLTCDVAT